MIKMKTYLRPEILKNGDKFFPVLGVLPLEHVGEEVEIFLKKKKVASGYIKNLKTVRLMRITKRDLSKLAGFVSLASFWARTERAFGGGLPGEYQITFVTLTEFAKKQTKKLSPDRSKFGSNFGIKSTSMEDFESRVTTYTPADLFNK